LIEGVLSSIVGVLIVGGIILLIVLILRKKRKNQKKMLLTTNEQSQEQQSQNENNPEAQKEGETTDKTISQTLSTHYQAIASTHLVSTNASKSTPSIEIANKHQIPFQDIKIEKELGKGSYGKVCLGRWNRAQVALKFCKEKEGLQDFWREANLMMYKISCSKIEMIIILIVFF
jgi:hypothetical protein